MSSLTHASTALAGAASQAIADNAGPALLATDARFDPDASLIWGKSSGNRYHTQLKPGTAIHPTRESAEYAAALLDSPVPWRRDRGAAIMARLLQLQDKDPASKSCGIWSWYWEEPLPQMAPPDWNWADFIGTQLMRVLRSNGPDDLPAGLHAGICEALHFAANSIRRRDVTLGYTNIAIMGTYVTVMAGHELGDSDLLAYGQNRLRKFVAFTRDFGGFPEYNSPTYTAISIAELSRMMRDFPTEVERALVREVLDRAWSEIALHWHAPSRQWAGPHSRSYSTMLQPNLLAFIQRGLGNRATVIGPESPHPLPPLSLDWEGLHLHCPDSLIPHFQNDRPQSHLVSSLSPTRPAIEGHTHLTPEFALSSVERGSFWNQFRVVSAYAPGQQHATAFCMRFLHDGYDFSSLNILTRQGDANILGAFSMAYDGGDKHPSLDRFPDARISAEDWRLRLEFTDPVDVEALTSLKLGGVGTQWAIPFGTGATLSLRWLSLIFGESRPTLEITQSLAAANACGHQRLTVSVDLIFYSGIRREFVFDRNFVAAIAYGLSLKATNCCEAEDLEKIAVTSTETHLQLEWHTAKGTLKLSSHLHPQKEADIIAWTTDQKLRD
ncbi:MAG: hypothetical protein ACAI35_10170 [Candidatus Methylacidiphilales bacterium]|nr:hypothetical protein [Candidatus Methylacidiphilales bacterium]